MKTVKRLTSANSSLVVKTVSSIQEGVWTGFENWCVRLRARPPVNSRVTSCFLGEVVVRRNLFFYEEVRGERDSLMVMLTEPHFVEAPDFFQDQVI